MPDLSGSTMFISGGSRGIGLAIALRAARDGANVALVAKTAEPHPRLEGTSTRAAEAIERRGQALPVVGDIRDEESVQAAVAAERRALRRDRHLRQQRQRDQSSGTETLEMKRYDLMQDINTRGTFVVSKACIPHLKKARTRTS